MLRNIDAFTGGARSVDAAAKAKVVWLNTGYDPAREREAATASTAENVDVFYRNTDSPVVVQVAEAKGPYAFGQDSDMSPIRCVCYADMLAGRWVADDTQWGMAEDRIQLSPLSEALPPDAAEGSRAAAEKIRERAFHPFAGPLTGPGGQLLAAGGQVISEDDSWRMKWRVEGVKGKVPSRGYGVSMEIDFRRLGEYEGDELMESLIVPHPIALVTTSSPGGFVNAAPFSMFNLVGEEPPS